MIAAQLIIYLLVFTLMVKIEVRGNALNGIYFYPREVQKRAVEIGLIDETMMSIKRLVSAQMLIRAFCTMIYSFQPSACWRMAVKRW